MGESANRKAPLSLYRITQTRGIPSEDSSSPVIEEST
jgi:hypothetical protein